MAVAAGEEAVHCLQEHLVGVVEVGEGDEGGGAHAAGLGIQQPWEGMEDSEGHWTT